MRNLISNIQKGLDEQWFGGKLIPCNQSSLTMHHDEGSRWSGQVSRDCRRQSCCAQIVKMFLFITTNPNAELFQQQQQQQRLSSWSGNRSNNSERSQTLSQYCLRVPPCLWRSKTTHIMLVINLVPSKTQLWNIYLNHCLISIVNWRRMILNCLLFRVIIAKQSIETNKQSPCQLIDWLIVLQWRWRCCNCCLWRDANEVSDVSGFPTLFYLFVKRRKETNSNSVWRRKNK